MTDQNKQIEHLEVKVAFLENALSELSDEHYAQQKHIEQLSIKIEALLDKLATLEGGSKGEITHDERPPHY